MERTRCCNRKGLWYKETEKELGRSIVSKKNYLPKGLLEDV